jgi:hypothetical protein
MEQLQFDGRTKQIIKDSLLDFLYLPVERHFKHRLDTIIIRNTILGGHAEKTFHYKGQQYHCEETRLAPRAWNKLDSSLRADMDEYLRDVSEIEERERPFIEGYIIKVLNSSNAFGDYLRLLPDSAHQPLMSFMQACPCQTKQLNDARIEELLVKNKHTINMMKTRMVTNLLL